MPVVAFRFVRSRRGFVKAPAVVKELRAAHEKTLKKHFIGQFEEVVANWSHKPSFRGRTLITPDKVSLSVFPSGSDEAKQIWWWNVKGTKAHTIAAKNAPRLAFMWGGKGSYMAKTGAGGTWFGGAGSVAGGSMRYPQAVQHPGFKGRNWPTVIMEKGENKRFYSRTVENAFRRGIRKMK